MCMPGLMARQVTCQAGCQLLDAEAQLPALPAALAHQPPPMHRLNSALLRQQWLSIMCSSLFLRRQDAWSNHLAHSVSVALLDPSTRSSCHIEQPKT